MFGRPHCPLGGPQPLSIWRPPCPSAGFGGPPTLVHLETALSFWRVGGPQPLSILETALVGGRPTLVHLQTALSILEGWRGSGIPPAISSGLGKLYIETELGDYRLATTQGCGRQPLQPSKACQGLAGARQRPTTHSRRGVVGGFRVLSLRV